MSQLKCPKCGSNKVDKVEEQDAMFLVCSSCGYDEREAMNVLPEERSRQFRKSENSPYKVGGPRRTQKK